MMWFSLRLRAMLAGCLSNSPCSWICQLARWANFRLPSISLAKRGVPCGVVWVLMNLSLPSWMPLPLRHISSDLALMSRLSCWALRVLRSRLISSLCSSLSCHWAWAAASVPVGWLGWPGAVNTALMPVSLVSPKRLASLVMLMLKVLLWR